MTKLNQLINFIDQNTKNGFEPIKEPWGKGAGFEDPGVDLVNSLDESDWNQLKEICINKSIFWIECLLHLIESTDSKDIQSFLIHLALNGSDEVTLNTMEYIRDFINDLEIELKTKLENKSWKIIKSRMK